ncbi:MAG TPA: YbjN domain-containing protein [Acidimicrobiales bacterium]|nr:YbjN domain-containing protein [Acidimicrobiales bacterium]
MPVDPASTEELDRLATLIETWAERERATNPVVAAVDRDPEARRWYVRLLGEEKQVTTVWLTLRERTLHYETYFMPAPEENVEALWEYLLRLNARLFAMRFAIGAEDAVYLVGQLPVTAVDGDELDRIIGSAYAYSEQWFRPAMRIGYASKFTG